jgi:thiosulfate dehydrogenase [quinone] large subunit
MWQRRLSDPGWLMLPLRGFLGFTFIYAGLQKFANPDFFDPASPLSVAGQMRAFEHTSPIAPLVGLAAHLPTVTGAAIALGELAVGVGAVLGAFTRLAAAGGLALSLSFFLTVSWTTVPYYYGADIVFAFAWLTLLLAGDRGVLSVGRWLTDRGRGADNRDPAGRRAAVRIGGLAAAVAVLAAVTAFTGRHLGVAGARVAGPVQEPTTATRPSELPAPTRTTSRPPITDPQTAGAPVVTAPPTHPPATDAPPATAAGTPIGSAASIPAGQAMPFADPATGDPAWLVHTTAGKFVAFDAICTHAGCTVGYDAASAQFRCPCHGGRFDAGTGGVLQGPPEAPLRPIPVRLSGGELRVRT